MTIILSVCTIIFVIWMWPQYVWDHERKEFVRRWFRWRD